MTTAALDPLTHYWPRYCEENVWFLCDALLEAGGADEALVLVVTNAAHRVAMFRQRAARRPDGLIVWDYHVVLAVRDDLHWQIVDADTTLPRPCAAAEYLDTSFPPLIDAAAHLRPMFRVTDAAAYHAALGSDRRHMRDPLGDWLSAPPPWPEIGDGHNLDRFLDVEDPFIGDVLDLEGLRDRIGAGAVC